LVQSAQQRFDGLDGPHAREQFLLLCTRARLMKATGKHANANRFAAMARELAAAEGYDQYNPSALIRVGFAQIDVAATPSEGARVRVRCPVCGQRYQGSEKRIRSLQKCLKCGMRPFKPLRVHDGD
jgi:hypothetical protein